MSPRIGRAVVHSAMSLAIVSLATLFAAVVAPGTALADECGTGMTMNQTGVCIPATVEESASVPPEWKQASGGDAVDPDSPTSVCQSSPPCPEGQTLILSDCECPSR